MSVTVSDVMRQLRNYFIADTLRGTFTIADGVLEVAPALPGGSWIAVEGAGALDGVHELDAQGRMAGAEDGSWTGIVHLLSPSGDFLRLCDEIRDWADKHPDGTLQAEKFGEYSRSQTSCAWERVFEKRLRPYQKMFTEVHS